MQKHLQKKKILSNEKCTSIILHVLYYSIHIKVFSPDGLNQNVDYVHILPTALTNMRWAL